MLALPTPHGCLTPINLLGIVQIRTNRAHPLDSSEAAGEDLDGRARFHRERVVRAGRGGWRELLDALVGVKSR